MPILETEDFLERAAELQAVGRFFHSRNWAPATSGNYSARVDSDNIAVTVSGAHKGELSEQEIMVVKPDGSMEELNGHDRSKESIISAVSGMTV